MALMSTSRTNASSRVSGPEFAQYFEQQNTAVATGTVQGEELHLVALGINNGWFDPTLQYKAYIDFAYNVSNTGRASDLQY